MEKKKTSKSLSNSLDGKAKAKAKAKALSADIGRSQGGNHSTHTYQTVKVKKTEGLLLEKEDSQESEYDEDFESSSSRIRLTAI